MHEERRDIDPGSYLLGRDIAGLRHILEHIMAKVDELNAKVDALQQTVDDDQAGDAAVVAALQAEIDALKAAAADGLTGAEADALAGRLDTIMGDVSGPNV